MQLIFDAEEAKWCKLYANPDNRVLGKRLGKAFKKVKKLISKLTHDELLAYEASGSIVLGDVALGAGDLQIKREFTKYVD